MGGRWACLSTFCTSVVWPCYFSFLALYFSNYIPILSTLISNFSGPFNKEIAFLRPSFNFELHQFESLNIYSCSVWILHWRYPRYSALDLLRNVTVTSSNVFTLASLSICSITYIRWLYNFCYVLFKNVLLSKHGHLLLSISINICMFRLVYCKIEVVTALPILVVFWDQTRVAKYVAKRLIAFVSEGQTSFIFTCVLKMESVYCSESW
jgi:hypothetical protein